MMAIVDNDSNLSMRKRSSLSFFETKIETLVVHGLHSRIFRAFSAAWRAARGGGEEPFDLQIASRFPSFLNASLFSSFAHLLLYAECNYPNCRHSKHSVALVGDARYRPPRITSLSSEHADTLVRSKRDPSPLIKSRVENEPPDNSSSSSFCPFSRTFAYSLVQ